MINYLVLKHHHYVTTVDGGGTILGGLNKSTLKNSTVIDCNTKAVGTVGGLVGQVGEGSTVDGCFVYNTSVTGTRNHSDLGSRVGGVTGWLIEHFLTETKPVKKGWKSGDNISHTS